jgi:hypothetical protein
VLSKNVAFMACDVMSFLSSDKWRCSEKRLPAGSVSPQVGESSEEIRWWRACDGAWSRGRTALLGGHPFSLPALAVRFSYSHAARLVFYAPSSMHVALPNVSAVQSLVISILRKLAVYSGAFRLCLTAVYDCPSDTLKTKKCVSDFSPPFLMGFIITKGIDVCNWQGESKVHSRRCYEQRGLLPVGTTICVASNWRFGGTTVFLFVLEFRCNINVDTVSSFEMLGTNTRLHEVTSVNSQPQRERQTPHDREV